MKNFGKTFYKFRINKGMKQKDLSDKKISLGQVSNIETGLQMPSVEKFMDMLGKLNVGYDEFIFMMGDEYLISKTMMDKKLAEFVKHQNINGLVQLSKKASDTYLQYHDVYFEHINLMALAMSQLIKSNNNYQSAKGYLKPIKDYLDNIDEWGYYEVTLISNCIFMFEVETAIYFGERALKLIEKNHSFYKDKNIGCVLLNNLTIYTLDYELYYHLSIKYSQMAISTSAINSDGTRALKANIMYQIVCFKSANGMYSKEKLLSLIKVFELLEWHKEYERLQKFIKKHGIVFSTLKEKA